MKRILFLVLAFLVLVVSWACGISFDGGYQQPPQASQPQPQQPVVITVVVPVEPQPQQQQEQPVYTPIPPTPIPPTSAPSGPIFTANRDLFCAEGPDWQLYWFLILILLLSQR